MTRAAIAIVSTASTGTPLALTFDRVFEPGMPRSRENAKHMREALVRQAVPQNSCPTVAIRITSLAAQLSRAEVKTAGEYPAAASIALTSVAAKVIASSTIQPIIAE